MTFKHSTFKPKCNKLETRPIEFTATNAKNIQPFLYTDILNLEELKTSRNSTPNFNRSKHNYIMDQETTGVHNSLGISRKS